MLLTCAYSCASLSKLVQARQGVLDPLHAILHLGSVPTELLAKGQGGSVLGVCAPNLDDVIELL